MARRKEPQNHRARVAGDPDFMLSLSRGLAVMCCFAEQRRPMTISQTAQRTGISRASVRRCLHTLVKLGYAEQDGQHFALRSKALALGYAYLSSNALAVPAQPLLDRLRDTVHESCSMAVMEGDELCYVARSETARIMSVTLRVGSRLPLYCTSMGRILLAHLTLQEQQQYLTRVPLLQRTSRARVRIDELLELLAKVKKQGYCMVDQELELGLRSIAVPVIDCHGRVVAAINVGTASARVSLSMMQARFLQELRVVAAAIGAQTLKYTPSSHDSIHSL